jgi:plastocyanin
MVRQRQAVFPIVVVLALSSVACDGSGSGGGCTAGKATALSGSLTMQNRAFSPDCFKVASGSTIAVDNKDSLPHTFTIKGSDVDLLLRGRQAGSATAPAVGTYDFICKIHPEMTGTIVVT